jgi:hypothetical protein
MKSVYSAVRNGPLNKAVCAPPLKGKEAWKQTATPSHAFMAQLSIKHRDKQ